MNRFKKWLVGAWITIASALGVQYSRPPVMETEKPKIESTATPTPTPVIVVLPTPTPSKEKRPKMNLKSISGATPEEIIFIKDGFDKANEALASDCFKNKVILANFTETNGMSNQEIYDHIAKAPIDVKAEMFYGSYMQNYVYKTMGYDIGDGVVYMNRFYVDKARTVGSLATHEGEGHGQGFHHEFTKATSIPYQWNDFIEECYKD